MCRCFPALLLFLAAPALAAQQPAGVLVVLNKAAASASLVDPASGRTIATLPTGDGPHEVAVSDDGKLAVVADYGGGGDGGHTLTVLDIPARTRVRTIDLAPHRRPHGLAWLPDGRRVAVTSEASQALLLVDVASGTVAAAIPTGARGSHMVALAPDGRRAYVANIAAGSVTMLDLEQRTALATTATGAGAEGIDVTPDGREVWVTNREANTVSVLDAATLAVKATLPSADFPIRVKLTPDGRLALVSNARSGELRLFDTRTRLPVGTITMTVDSTRARGTMLGTATGGVPIGILVEPGGRRAYVANANADLVTVIDLDARAIVGWLETGREPDGLGWAR
ncbi:MAG TPA: cytochrome D1 domain-containing protein [Gemmatimonadaceae bacterium]|jgi:YVTN family beta-propeller protein|nr:cytochrome D1 domain-containing protein [Gemmatimonadaceae bacterium]